MNEIVKNNLEKTEKDNKFKWELKNLKVDVINQKLNNLELSKSSKQILDLIEKKSDWTKTNMYQKLEKLEWWEFNIEKFATDIDKTTRKYLYQSFIDKNWEFKVSDDVVSSMSVWVQFAMMKTLTVEWKKWVDFLSSFSEIKTDSVTWMFDGLFDTLKWNKWLFGKVGKLNEFYVLANRFQNLIWYVSYNSGKEKPLWDGSKVAEIMNSAKFVKLLDNPILDSQDWLFKRNASEVGLTISEPSQQTEMSNEDKEFLQAIADDPNIPIDKKTIDTIRKAIPTAQNILEKRLTFKDAISSIVDKIWWLLEINIFWLWTIWSLLWFNGPLDMLRSEKWQKKWILDFILIWMWFQWWVEWVHREYVRKNIDENLDSDEKKNFISEMFKYYDKEKKTEYKWVNTIDKFWLSKMNDSLKNKIPTQYDLIKKSLSENISWNEKLINPAILAKYGFKNFLLDERSVDKNWKEVLKSVVDDTKLDQLNIDEKFVDKYLEDTFKELISDDNFMKDIENPDQFTLALMWKFVAGNWFVEWVLIWEETVDDYLRDRETQSKFENINKNLSDEEILKNIDTELKNNNSKIEAKDVLGSSKKYDVPVEYIMAFMKNDSTYATAWKWARTNNPGNIWNDDVGNEKNYENLKDGVYALWEHLRQRIDEYKKVYWLVSFPTAKELADNIWPDGKWFLSNQENYKAPNLERKGAYMTKESWWFSVDKFVRNLTISWISNYRKVA